MRKPAPRERVGPQALREEDPTLTVLIVLRLEMDDEADRDPGAIRALPGGIQAHIIDLGTQGKVGE